MSPEVQKGLKHDNKVDAYDVGLILWWMLFGSTYFKDSDTTPKIIEWDVIANRDSLVLDFLHKLLEESPKERWTVKAMRRHSLLGNNASSLATDTIVISEGSVAEGDSNPLTSSAIPTDSVGVALANTMGSGPICANLSELIIEGTPAGDVSTSSEVSSTSASSVTASVRFVKRNREVSSSSPAPSGKRRKVNPSTNDTEINDEVAWTLDNVRMKTTSYVKSVSSAVHEWGQW
ncbi:hypothetical protein FRB94_007440 [Tulasnella sp. JGI-2019a]|nr:hypothetical protein FRB94_007440 [Tulasnella sp. JGI-2019a]